jgi:hypothetical protein
MSYSSPKQLCFPPVVGQTIRADFEGGALSSDFGALLLRGARGRPADWAHGAPCDSYCQRLRKNVTLPRIKW